MTQEEPKPTWSDKITVENALDYAKFEIANRIKTHTPVQYLPVDRVDPSLVSEKVETRLWDPCCYALGCEASPDVYAKAQAEVLVCELHFQEAVKQ